MNTSTAYPKTLNSLVSLFKQSQTFSYMIFGYAACRCVSGLPSWIVFQDEPLAWHNTGKLIGIIASIALVYLVYKKHKAFLIHSSFGLIALLGSLLFIGKYLFFEQSFIFGNISLLLMGFGTTTMTLQWLEEISKLSLKQIPLAIGAGEALNSLAIITIAGKEPLSFFYLLLFIVLSLFLFAVVRQNEFSHKEPKSLSSSNKLAPPKLSTLISGKLILWVTIYCFISGYISSLTGLSMHSLSDSLGNILPGIAIILCSVVFSKSYDIRVLRSMAFAFMVLSIILLWLFDADNTWIHILASAGAASCRIFAYSLACIHSHANKVSSIPACAVVKSLIVVATVFGHNLETLSISIDTNALFALATLLICILNIFFSPFTVKDENALDRIKGDPGTTSQVKNILETATEKGLSQRETTVYILMIGGEKTADISDRLFISKSAVRTHMSRIYSKFDMHNRQEFDDFIKREFRQEDSLENLNNNKT